MSYFFLPNKMPEADFPIGTNVIWNSSVYGQVRGTIISEPWYNSGLLVYSINPWNNSEREYPIIYVPHQMYGLTRQLFDDKDIAASEELFADVVPIG
jgi:hypothetical protein